MMLKKFFSFFNKPYQHTRKGMRLNSEAYKILSDNGHFIIGRGATIEEVAFIYAHMVGDKAVAQGLLNQINRGAK